MLVPPRVSALLWLALAGCEGWAHFVAVASMWDRATTAADAPAGILRPSESGSGIVYQVELIDGCGFDQNWGSKNRDCECDDDTDDNDDLSSSTTSQMCDSSPAAALWDLYDTANENVSGCSGFDNSSAPFDQIMDGWWDFGTGSENNEDLENQCNDGTEGCDPPATGVASKLITAGDLTKNSINRARNLNDFDLNLSVFNMSDEMNQACADASEGSGT